jgi:tetratricopeptide (TPR) repeat protein
VPYIGIAKTYSRLGEFFIAALNAEKALEIDPTNPNTYGQLGTIYTRARNYESALPVLGCTVNGCSIEEANALIQELMPYSTVEVSEPVPAMALTNLEVAYYYAQYGSVLAALSRPESNNCPDALAVLNQVRQTFPEDPGLVSIVEENEAICRLIAATPVPQSGE